ncbi:hypothetical protein JCM8097_000820 [Rhodosporidiobolus ruineniae]
MFTDPPCAVSFDVSRLLVAHTALSGLASLSNAPVWDIPVALYGLVTVQNLDGPNGADAARTFIAIFAGSLALDLIWFVSNSTHGLARLLLLLNILLKPLTLISTLSQLSSRGEGMNLPTGGFSVPSSITNRIPGSFPPYGQQRGAETVWSAPPPQQAPGSYQGRFSLDDDLEAGGAVSGASTPSATSVPPPSKKGSSKAAAKGGEQPEPPYSAGGTSAAEGGGYHSIA